LRWISPQRIASFSAARRQSRQCFTVFGDKAGDAASAAETCFLAWVEHRGGTGAADVDSGIKAVRAFLQVHGPSRCQKLGSPEVRITTEYQDEQLRNALRKNLDYWMLLDATTTERQEAKAAAERAMAQVPTGAARDRLERAIETATASIAERVKARCETEKQAKRAEALADSHLHYIEEYVRAEYDIPSVYDQWQTVRELKTEIRPDLIATLRQNDLTTDEIKEWIEETVDGLLED
jgi:hypothetical protein